MTMSYIEIYKTLCLSEIQYEGVLPIIYMENEIFEDIKKSEVEGSGKVAQIYTYYFLVKLLYRYALYGFNPDLVNVSTHKKILGYSDDYRGINFIIKKGGVLNKMGYTTHISNYPISWSYEDGDLDFCLVKDKKIDEFGNELNYALPSQIIKNLHPNAKIHFPIKAFTRNYSSLNEGSFFNISSTHGIEVETFIHCMSKEELGPESFYVYGFIKHKNDWKGDFWDSPIEDLYTECGIKKTKLIEVLKALEQYNMISVLHAPWVVDRPSYAKTKASSYFANPSKDFYYEKMGTEKHIKVSWDTCKKKYASFILELGETEESEENNNVGERKNG
jgi:hypothetical protein